jgi:hypothetical protein
MNSLFGKDKVFQDTIQPLVKDKTAQALRRMHLKAARHEVIFHLLPDRFAAAIAKTPPSECVFASAVGRKKGDIHFWFADIIAAEMMEGTRIDDAGVVNSMMEKTLALVIQFVDLSEDFI